MSEYVATTLTKTQKHSSDSMKDPIQCVVQHRKIEQNNIFHMSKQLKTNHEMLSQCVKDPKLHNNSSDYFP